MKKFSEIRQFFLGSIPILLFVALFSVAAAAQGNTVSGQVTGVENRPIYDATVELLDEFLRTLKYTKTDGAGRYYFSGVPRGRFSVRVRSIEPEYDEMTQEEEVQNITRSGGNDNPYVTATDHKQLDFRLRLRRGFTGVTAALFVQDVPAPAKKLYDQAVKDLSEKRNSEGLAALRSAIEIFPKYYAALEMLGTEYIKMKQFPASATLLQLAAEVNPRSYRTWYGLAYSFNALNMYVEAQKAVDKALELFASAPDANLLAGVIYRSQKKTKEAEKFLLKAKETSKDTIAMANWHLAKLYAEDLKNYGEAAKELKSFLKKQPESFDAEKIKQLITDYEAKAKIS